MRRATSALESMTGRRLPGGCESCDGYQVLSRCADDLYVLTVHHDSNCPVLTAARPSNGAEHAQT
jgi:hypothetical protein